MIEQYDLFANAMPRYRIDKPVRMVELFAGIGSQYEAMKRIGADVVPWKVVEIDKYAMASYNAIHGTEFETSDITQIHAKDLEIVDTDHYCYIMTYSFPCQDLSIAGNQKGMSKGTGTRSGLLWEVERILDECDELPQILLMENVPAVVGTKNIEDFKLWRRKLETLGYSCAVKLLNSKDFGIPQNRNRCYMLSILGNYYYEFPKPIPLELRLKDLLEDHVDEKYYLSENVIHLKDSNPEDTKIKIAGMLDIKGRHESALRVYDPNHISPTLNTFQGGGLETKIVEQPVCIGSTRPHATVTYDGVCPTIDTMQGGEEHQ